MRQKGQATPKSAAPSTQVGSALENTMAEELTSDSDQAAGLEQNTLPTSQGGSADRLTPTSSDHWVETDIAQYPLEGGFDGAERDWNALSRQVWQLSRLAAVFLFFAMIIGWPLGDFLAYLENVGTASGWSLFRAYPAGIVMFALVVPALLLFCGYVLSRAMTTTQAAEAMAAAARQYVVPDEAALREVETVGTVVRTQMDGLNAGLDEALMRLAGAEAMIRQHVDAIETAGAAIEAKATNAVERVASERSRLIEATEQLNEQADSFANAIAERAEANIEAMDRADEVSGQVEARFEERLGGLEKATGTALDRFRQLLDALGGADENVRTTADALKAATDRTVEATEKTRAATADARKAAEEAILNAAEEATRESVQKAIAETQQKAEQEALALAREEAGKIARTAVEQAGLEIEKIAREAGESAQTSAQETLKFSQEATDAAMARKAELAKAHQALEAENKRLETLIAEQKARAERLSHAIALQTDKLARMAETMPSSSVAAADMETAIDLSAEQQQGQQSDGNEKAHDVRGSETASPTASKDVVRQEPEGPKRAEISTGLKVRFLKPVENEDEANRQAGDIDNQRAAESSFETAVQSPRQDLQRLSDLARDLAESRTDRQHKAREHKNDRKLTERSMQLRDNKSWKEILAAADGAAPLDLGTETMLPLDAAEVEVADRERKADMHAPVAMEPIDLMPEAAIGAPLYSDPALQDLSERELHAFRVIHRLQQFTLNLDHRLYGACPPALVERFEAGDRNIFANRLLRLNEMDVKKRIRLESAKDRKFESDVRDFLKEFDRLLEEAAQSNSVDEELREYLSSPLGRMYLLIGEIVGYFA